MLTSCAPVVNKVIVKSYPTLPASNPVNIYYSKAFIPLNAESLGVVSVKDGGGTAATKCDSITVIEIIKNEVRKIGGNAAFISEYVKPSVWGSACHQMTATALKINDIDDLMLDTAPNNSQIIAVKTIKPERKLPIMRLSADIGYAYRTANYEESSQNPVIDKLLKEMKNAPSFTASLDYFFTDFIGIGLTYSGFYSNKKAIVFNSASMYGANGKTSINLIAPTFTLRAPIRANKKWIIMMDLGIGYLDYTINISNLSNSYFYEEHGATVGFFYNGGIEYKIKNLGIGLSAALISGIVNTIHINDNGQKSIYTIDYTKGEQGVGLGQFKLGIGLRYYFIEPKKYAPQQ